LAMLNWLRDPTLYPNDRIREGYIRFPTVFWRAVALVPSHVSTEAVLFVVFLATKIMFFYGLVRLARLATPESHFVRGIVVLIALSPILNIRTPFGYSPVLDPIQTQTPLAIAVMVCAGALLAEGRWVRSAILAAACVYLNAIFVIFMLFPFGVLAVSDFRRYKKRVILSALAGATTIVPWLLGNRALIGAKYPPEYVPALLLFFPRHLVLSTHNPIDLLYGPAFLCVAFAAVMLARKKCVVINRRLEIMACSFAIPVALGAVAGQHHLTPLIATLQLMRADVFLFLFAALLLAASIFQLAKTGVLPYGGAILTISAVIFVLPLTPMRLFLLLLGIGMTYWNLCVIAICSSRIHLRDNVAPGGRAERLSHETPLVGVVVIFAAMAIAVSADHRALDVFTSAPRQGDWFDVQRWARVSTSRDSVFLVPPNTQGFRIESLRSSWGEWKDGTALYWDAQFAGTYVHRLNELGVYKAPVKPADSDAMGEVYRLQSHEHLLSIARENNLQYIVQFSGATSDTKPVYSNRSFSVYPVSP